MTSEEWIKIFTETGLNPCISNEERKKGTARVRIQNHPERRIILFNCGHSDRIQVNHHPDYDKSYEVHLLCRKCHYAVHYIPRKEEVRMCPKCKSPWWDIPKDKKKEKLDSVPLENYMEE